MARDALGLIGFGGDQDIDRVADDVDADEDDHRHREHDEDRLDQSPQQPGGHQEGSIRVTPSL